MLYIYFYYFSSIMLCILFFIYILGIVRNRQILLNLTTRLCLWIHFLVSFYFFFFLFSSSLSPILKTLSILFHSTILLLTMIFFFSSSWLQRSFLSFALGFTIVSLILYIFLMRWNWMYLYVHLCSLDHFFFHSIISLLIVFLIFMKSHEVKHDKKRSLFFVTINILFKIIPSVLKEVKFLGKTVLLFYRSIVILGIVTIFIFFNPIFFIVPIIEGYPSLIPSKGVMFGASTISNQIRVHASKYYKKSSTIQDKRHFPCVENDWICSSSYPACEKGVPYYTENTKQWKHQCWQQLIDKNYLGKGYSFWCRYCYRSAGQGDQAFFQMKVACMDTCRYSPAQKYLYCNKKNCVSEYLFLNKSERFRKKGGFAPEPEIQFDFSILKRKLKQEQ